MPEPEPVGPPLAAIGVFVDLHAFASGSTALTGVEAVSNGVSAFGEPRGRNAARTLAILGAVALTLSGGLLPRLLCWGGAEPVGHGPL